MLAVVVVISVGCSSDGFPESYEDQIDAETGLSNIALNWRDGCEPSLNEELADNAASICECSFSRIKNDIIFEDFIAVNDRFSDNPEILNDLASSGNATAAQIVEIVKTCIAAA